jgi:nucleoid DNA-binding protein
MNKSGLIEELARRENLTEKKATDVSISYSRDLRKS